LDTGFEWRFLCLNHQFQLERYWALGGGSGWELAVGLWELRA
jgi:hypothetical protein